MTVHPKPKPCPPPLEQDIYSPLHVPLDPPPYRFNARSVARNSGSADTACPVACFIQRSGSTVPYVATRSNSDPRLAFDELSFSSIWNAIRCPSG